MLIFHNWRTYVPLVPTIHELSVYYSGVFTAFQPPCLHICAYFAHTLQDYLFFFQFFKYLFLLAFFVRPYSQNDRPQGRDFAGDRKIKGTVAK